MTAACIKIVAAGNMIM